MPAQKRERPDNNVRHLRHREVAHAIPVQEFAGPKTRQHHTEPREDGRIIHGPERGGMQAEREEQERYGIRQRNRDRVDERDHEETDRDDRKADREIIFLQPEEERREHH